MRNVYEEVQCFYREEVLDEAPIRQELVEGFLRHKAWQGAPDRELRRFWQSLRFFMLYLIHTGKDSIDDIPYYEFSWAVEWLGGRSIGFKISLRTVRDFFHNLIEFYSYLAGRKLIADTNEIERAARIIAGGKRVKLIPLSREPNESGEANNIRSILGSAGSPPMEDFGELIGETVEQLMSKIGAYFQGDSFNRDFERALFLYTGPLNEIPAEKEEGYAEFWLGFWDYFLFDYHLLGNDAKPLEHFYNSNRDSLSADECKIVKDLLSARFTVFYISKVLNNDWVECTDLFTDEKFELPNPELDYKRLKKLLLFGHVFSRDMIVINYVTTIEVSANLRRRIKQEVSRQKKLYEFQRPNATWAEFLSRHALAVRHTIDILSTLAKVNVTRFQQIDRVFPKIEKLRAPNREVLNLLKTLMPRYRFSKHDIELAGKMWSDFSQLNPVSVRKPALWAASVIYTYADLNSPYLLSAENIARDLGILVKSVYSGRRKIIETLQMEPFDPRYLSEEGFIFSIIMS